MNAIEFKEKLEKSKEADLLKFLADYKEEWGESLEETVDKILNEHANDKTTTEPFEIDRVNYELLVKQGEWEVVSELPKELSYTHVYPRCGKYMYKNEFVLETVKRKWFGTKIIETELYYRCVYQQERSISYSKLTYDQKKYFKKILTDKGFFVSRASGFMYARLNVYWNKEQYDWATK